MKSLRHVFHTRHDFKPDLGWEAFQLLSEIPPEWNFAFQLAYHFKSGRVPLSATF